MAYGPKFYQFSAEIFNWPKGEQLLPPSSCSNTAAGAIRGVAKLQEVRGITGRIGITLLDEHSQSIFTAYGDSVQEAVKVALEMSRKSRACGGR